MSTRDFWTTWQESEKTIANVNMRTQNSKYPDPVDIGGTNQQIPNDIRLQMPGQFIMDWKIHYSDRECQEMIMK